MPMEVPLRDAFDAGKTAFGLWNTIPNVAVARTIASTHGISWVLIDAEHGQLNDTHLYAHALAISGAGPSPIVRIPVDEAWLIKRALDAGAHGILAPLVPDAQRARAVIAAAKYATSGGVRGFGPMYTHHTFGARCSAAEYREGADAKLVVMVQIENKEAVQNVDEIAQVAGLDVLFIGPFDLALTLGVTFGSEAHEEAISKVLAAAKKHGKKAAIYCQNGEQAYARAKQGFDMISVATDVDVITQGFAAHVAAAAGITCATSA